MLFIAGAGDEKVPGHLFSFFFLGFEDFGAPAGAPGHVTSFGAVCRLGLGCVFFLHSLNSQWYPVLTTRVLSFLHLINLSLCLFKGTQGK